MPFRTPLGVYPIARGGAAPFLPERGYRVTVTRADRSPYFFEISVPVPELWEVFRALAEVLPDMVYPILERPPEPDEDSPRVASGRIADLGPYMRRGMILQQYAPHVFQLQNDGMLGAGMAGRFDNGAFRELFVDEHKTIRVICEKEKPVAEILADCGVERRLDLVLLSERPHAHRSLITLDGLATLFPENELAYDKVYVLLARGFGISYPHSMRR